MYPQHPYMGDVPPSGPDAQRAWEQAHQAAAVLGQEAVNQQLLDAQRSGELAAQQAAELAVSQAMWIVQDQQMRQMHVATAASAPASPPRDLTPEEKERRRAAEQERQAKAAAERAAQEVRDAKAVAEHRDAVAANRARYGPEEPILSQIVALRKGLASSRRYQPRAFGPFMGMLTFGLIISIASWPKDTPLALDTLDVWIGPLLLLAAPGVIYLFWPALHGMLVRGDGAQILRLESMLGCGVPGCRRCADQARRR